MITKASGSLQGRLLVGIWTFFIGGYCVVSAQVPAHQEPHHRPVFEDATLRVLDANIAPGDATADHRHVNDMLSVTIGATETRTRTPEVGWGAVRPRRQLGETNLTEYAGQPGTHAVQNIGTSLYRLIAVENLKHAAWSTESATPGLGVTVLNEGRAFRTYAVQFPPGTSAINRRHGVPWVIVLAAGEATVSRDNAQPQQLDESTRWVVVGAGESYTLSVRRSDQVRIVEIEVR